MTMTPERLAELDAVMAKAIPLTRGLVAIVDAADYEWLSQWKWHAVGTPLYSFYAARGVSENGVQSVVRMHRAILGASKDHAVDHINHDTLDNRRQNLRLCSQAENNRNKSRRRGSSSEYLGVSWCGARGKWQAQININSRNSYIGRFVSEIDAARAYDAAARARYGEFANLNFKDAA